MELRNLTIGYTPRNLVIQKNINLKLNPGELTCLLGPNGAGKTTLLRTLAGFIPPIDGEVLINGKSLFSYSREDLSKIVGVVLTERPSVTNMTVRQLIALGRSPYTDFWGKIKNDDLKYIENALKITNTTNLENRRIDTLSDGEFQKVMIAKALAQDTPIIMLDEPTAFLDFPSKVETLRLLSRLAREQNKAILQSTHDLNMALALSDTVWLMDKKLGVVAGSPRELAENETLPKYFEAPGLNFNKSKISFEISATN